MNVHDDRTKRELYELATDYFNVPWWDVPRKLACGLAIAAKIKHRFRP